MMAANQPLTIDRQYARLPGDRPPHPRNTRTVERLLTAMTYFRLQKCLQGKGSHAPSQH